jgi:4-hydroxy-4-methyl-2-oxoglutarate aldolase
VIVANAEKRRALRQMTGAWFGHEFLLDEHVRRTSGTLTIPYFCVEYHQVAGKGYLNMASLCYNQWGERVRNKHPGHFEKESTMDEFPDWLASTLASDATEGRGVLPSWIGPLKPDTRAVGPAFVALMSQDDNLSVREAIQAPHPPGSVLVVAGGGTSRTATIGGLMALEMQQAGIIALVTDGLVRDTREIRQMQQFSVWCRGVTPTASHKRGPAVTGGSVSIGGILIRDGDLVIADDDGVVIWPKEQIDALLGKADTKQQQDNARLARLQQDMS